MRNFLQIVAVVTLLITARPAAAQVIMDSAAPMDLYGNSTRAGVGDVLTVLITEGVTVGTGVNRTDKDTDNLKSEAGSGALDFVPALSKNGQHDRKSESTVKQNQSIQTTMTVRIVGVEPNGNLVLDGQRILWANKTKVTVSLHAVCRPADVFPDNTVSSSRLVDVALKVDGLPEKSGPNFFKTLFGIFAF